MYFKKFSTRFIVLLLIVSMMISMTGCTAGKGNASEKQAPAETVADEKTEIKITDHLGREVIINEKPERIVSVYYITTSMLIALGLEDKVVGIETGADKRPIYSLAAPQFLTLPNVGSPKNFDLEGCIALEPDLVILPIRMKDVVPSLEKLGINVIAVNPESMELLEESIDMISKATGTEDVGNKLKSYYENKLSEIKNLIDEEEKTRIYIGGNSNFLSTATKNMYQTFMVEAAGGINVASDIDDTYWATISYEQLLTYNPDVIIGVPSATYTKEDILKDERLKALNAVQNSQVYMMPDAFESWDSPVPSSILGTMWLTSILYEDKYPYDKFKEDAAQFYKEFYDLEINKEDLTK